MKKLLFLLFILLNSCTVFSQKTSINIKIPSIKGGLIELGRPTKWLNVKTSYSSFYSKKIDQNGEFFFEIDDINKEMLYLSVRDSTQNKDLFFQYFFISKGDNLLIEERPNKEIKITGKGANNNQLKGIAERYSFGEMKQDSIPNRIVGVINDFNSKEKKLIDSINHSFQLSIELQEALSFHNKYKTLAEFYSTYGNLSLSRRKELKRNNQSWVAALDKIVENAPISNDKALLAPSYHNFLRTFNFRKREQVLNDFDENSTLFYTEWFQGDSIVGKKTMEFDYKNQLNQKIIERYFSGKTKEQMYAYMFDSMISEQNFSNLIPIYADFKKKFPNSIFEKYFAKTFASEILKFDNKLTDKMVFLEGNFIANWDSISTHFKGKTVLIDMWGTWCSPCRQEINEHSAALKEHFKGKGLDFLYVANFDTNREKWKQLIAYYKMEGSHVFANEDLTNAIMRKVKGSGYPTYAIIDKNGKVEPSIAGYPMDRNLLIQQIEEVLKR